MRTKLDIIDQIDGTCYCDAVIHEKDDEYCCGHDYVSYAVSTRNCKLSLSAYLLHTEKKKKLPGHTETIYDYCNTNFGGSLI